MLARKERKQDWLVREESDYKALMPKYRRSAPVLGSLVPLQCNWTVRIADSPACKVAELFRSHCFEKGNREKEWNDDEESPAWPGGSLQSFELSRKTLGRRILEDYLGISGSGESTASIMRLLMGQGATFSLVQFDDLVTRSWNMGATGFWWGRHNLVPVVRNDQIFLAVAEWGNPSGSLEPWLHDIDNVTPEWQFEPGTRVVFRRPEAK